MGSLDKQRRARHASRMGTTWASVVIALGAAAIAALAGGFGSYLGFRSARLSVRDQARDAWRSKMREAAEDFCVVSNSVGWTARVALSADPETRKVDRDGLDAQWKELRRAQIRVDLTFGVVSRSSDAAAELVEMLTFGFAALTAWDEAIHRLGGHEDPEAWIKDAVDRFEEEVPKYDAFLQAAHAAIAPDEAE
jgi:hypothetical protein